MKEVTRWMKEVIGLAGNVNRNSCVLRSGLLDWH